MSEGTFSDFANYLSSAHKGGCEGKKMRMRVNYYNYKIVYSPTSSTVLLALQYYLTAVREVDS